VGFLRAEDRAFFTKFTTVKGMGVKKAIRALALPTGQVAAAIESGDARTLASLPGIGKRVAETIIAELKGKVIDFVLNASERSVSPVIAGTVMEAWSAEQRDALEVMVVLGERRADAQRWLERAMQLTQETHGADEWVRLAYRVRSGADT
jgi:Holliday junction DNA helicase RuvA